MLTHKMNRVLGLAVMGGWMIVGQAAMAGSIHTTYDFTGNSATNWGWGSKVDPNSQLGGTNQMTYTYGASNGVSYVSSTITDAAAVFPDGTGTVVIQFKLDISNYHTGTFDYVGPTVAEIASGGNKGSLPPGSISTIGVGGFNTPGQYRFSQSTAMLYAGGPIGTSIAYTLGTNPAFALIYDVTWTVTISGNDATSWSISSDTTLQGPIDSSGTIGTIVIPNATYTRTDASFNGWGSATAYNVGNSGNSHASGDSITLDSFSATAIPEPATLGLMALGGLLMVHRSKR